MTLVPLKLVRTYHAGMSWQTWTKRVKAHMEAAGITQEQAAERLGRTQGGVAHWLNGRRKINLDEFFQLCKAVGADPRLILFGDQEDIQLVDALGSAFADHPDLLRKIARAAAPDAKVAQTIQPAPRKRIAHKAVKRKESDKP